ncbi:hypothetical protein PR048_031907 [Dryococelus australis]|uniref:Uncharacterized protein n=1 Tax=Dryococelus australis TaxID=614101 RepID=A0ABQ9G773_9NEOP|nr:hypothetical protein PR048_031907 [Dryococelus australis]
MCQTLEDWGIPVQDEAIPVYCVTGTGANFKYAATSSFTPVQCFAHTLPNAITEAKKKQQELLELQAALSAEKVSPKDTSNVQMLAPQEWRHMSGLVQILRPPADATEELSGDSYPTLSMVTPILHCLESRLTS